MALASSDRPGGDAEAKPPDAAAAAAHQPTAHAPTAVPPPSACTSPAPHAEPRLEARRRGGASSRSREHARPGVRFQEQLLLDFHTTAIPGSVAPSPSPAYCWLTPTSAEKRFTLSFVRYLVNHLLTAAPGRLCVTRVAVRVFRVCVACVNVVNVLLVKGYLRLGSSTFAVHPSVEVAMNAGRALAGRRDDVRGINSHLPNGTDRSNSSKVHSPCPVVAQNVDTPMPVEDLTPLSHPCAFGAARCSHNAPPSPPRDTRSPVVGPPELPPVTASTGVNASHLPAAPGPYLKALLTPAPPPKTLARRPNPIVSTKGCFRCLASDHQVRDCRDPVRCRNCGGNQHRLRDCPMPISRKLTPMPRPRRHYPTVPVPASRAPVHAVPFFRPPPPPGVNPGDQLAGDSDGPDVGIDGSVGQDGAPPPVDGPGSAGGPAQLTTPPTPPPANGPTTHALSKLPPAPHATLFFHVAAALATISLAPLPKAPRATPSLPELPAYELPVQELQDTPPAPPPSPADPEPRVAPARGRRPAARKAAVPQRQSTRLAAMATANYVDLTDKAVQRKALLNSLAPCSDALQRHVKKRGLLNSKKLPISIPDLRKLVTAAGLGCSSACAIGAVPAPAE
ncbi:unnamed protein product [Urochloa decumbens]|uniref:CCHC-type domain-containing protein n=1 Tax=Urochloa decumbens TaxID=240449 RepID=A0ABC8W9S6_9POAL